MVTLLSEGQLLPLQMNLEPSGQLAAHNTHSGGMACRN